MKAMKSRLPAALLLIALMLGAGGCMTCNVLEGAKQQVELSNIGEAKVEREAQPARYALLPLTVPLDVVTSPIQAIAYFCVPRE